MGDRGNIVIKEPEGGHIFFYTHDNGSEIADMLQKALIRGRQCWKDGHYLARIIFSEMIKDSVLDTDGFGISTYLGDNEHDLLVVDCEEQLVLLVKGRPDAAPKDSWTFSEFANLNVEEEFGYGG